MPQEGPSKDDYLALFTGVQKAAPTTSQGGSKDDYLNLFTGGQAVGEDNTYVGLPQKPSGLRRFDKRFDTTEPPQKFDVHELIKHLPISEKEGAVPVKALLTKDYLVNNS